MISITPLYAGPLLVLFFWLSLRVSLLRLKGPVIDADTLKRAVRTQGNASEYIPLGLIALLILELQNAPGLLLHFLGLLLLIGRLGHFYAFSRYSGRSFIRKYSMVATYVMLCFSGLFILWFAITGS